MNENQADQIYENIDYIRGFKDALEWVLNKANAKETKEELVEAIAKLFQEVQTHHLKNIDELFPLKDA